MYTARALRSDFFRTQKAVYLVIAFAMAVAIGSFVTDSICRLSTGRNLRLFDYNPDSDSTSLTSAYIAKSNLKCTTTAGATVADYPLNGTIRLFFCNYTVSNYYFPFIINR
jgi:hypothetical protein